MTLEDIIADLQNIDNTLTIWAVKSPGWTKNSRAELHPSSEVSAQSPLTYFLEIPVAKNVIHAWSYARREQTPNLKQKCEAIIYYAENDAYILPK